MSLKRSKQSVVPYSFKDSEYITSLEVAQEVVWIKKFIRDLGIVPSIQDPMEIFYDNEGAIALAKEPISHKRTKHINRRFNYICDEFGSGEISIRKVHTNQTLADPFTKPLPQAKFGGHA